MSDAETLLHDLRAAVAALPVQTRISIDEAETVHYVTVNHPPHSDPHRSREHGRARGLPRAPAG